MSIYAVYLNTDEQQYLATNEDKNALVGELYRELHNCSGLDVVVTDIFAVCDNEVDYELEDEILQYVEACRVSFMLSERSKEGI